MRAAWCSVPVVHHSSPLPPGDHGFLTAGEQARLAAIRGSDHRDAFIARRWFVREVVAAAAGCGPEVVTVHQRCPRCGGPHGQPEVAVPDGPPLFASWSVTGRLQDRLQTDPVAGVLASGDVDSDRRPVDGHDHQCTG